MDKGKINLNTAWHDIKMVRQGPTSFSITLPLYETGHFRAKCFFVGTVQPAPLWPPGENTVINVESAGSYCANIIYNAFVRQFGTARWPRDPMAEEEQGMIHTPEKKGYTVIPSSGKFRDLVKVVDFIFGELGCRVLQILPVHPRFAMGIPDYWIRLLKEYKDEEWPLGSLWHELNSRRRDEKSISYAESHDQALVGDQTLFMRLMGENIYHDMGGTHPDIKTLRALALHKMIQ